MNDKKYDNNDEFNYQRLSMKSDIKDKGNNFEDVICRDYLRNVCKRERCKFLHPVRDESQQLYVFCHDYQNGGCIRVGCRFVHCTVEEEAYYYKHGELLPHVYETYKKTIDSLSEEENYSTCIDYIKGKCKRDSCKFRHVTMKDFPSVQSNRSLNKSIKCTHNEERCKRLRSDLDYCCEEYHNGYKRRYHREQSPVIERKSCDLIDDRRLWVLESENEMLRKRVMELKKKNDDLQATNEFLLEQNARIRIGDKATPSIAAVTVPAVTITNTGSLQHQGQVNMPQPQVMNALRTAVAASMATVPVSLAAVATTPVSIAAVSMAPVQIPPVVTVAQAPEQGLNGNLNTESQSLVSYPIINGSTIIQGTMQHR